jgi:hypothetical protein
LSMFLKRAKFARVDIQDSVKFTICAYTTWQITKKENSNRPIFVTYLVV